MTANDELGDASAVASRRTLRAALTLGWLAAGAALLRYWDLTLRVEGFLLWTSLFIGAYVLATLALRRFRLSRAANPWSDVWLWAAVVLAASVVRVLFPQLAWGTTTVQTAALVRVLDIVLPLWILHRGVHAAWRGRYAAGITLCVPIFLLAVLWFVSVRMPGSTYEGPPPPPSPVELEVGANAELHVRALSDSIGSRGARSFEAAQAAASYLRTALGGYGYEVEELGYVVDGRQHRNLQVDIPGASVPEDIIVVGAHYDTHDRTRGADDNATGVAAVLELARLMVGSRPARTVRFVLFGTEEPPYFNTEDMGSRVYARRAAESDEQIIAMYSLEMLGYYSDEAGSQRHPPPMQLFFPHRGDFVVFVGNPASGSLLRSSLRRFRETTLFPSEGVVSSSMLPGVELSDHASFWRSGFPAVLVSDTGPFRNDNYHLDSDTAGTLDFGRMARVVVGMLRVIEEVAGA